MFRLSYKEIVCYVCRTKTFYVTFVVQRNSMFRLSYKEILCFVCCTKTFYVPFVVQRNSMLRLSYKEILCSICRTKTFYVPFCSTKKFYVSFVVLISVTLSFITEFLARVTRWVSPSGTGTAYHFGASKFTPCCFLAHLSQRVMWAIAITWRPSSSSVRRTS
jgi:hypothetical protein